MGETKRFLTMHKRLELAIIDYDMIPKGSHVMVALSGGKDSSMLLKLLARPKVLSHNDFTLSAVFVRQGFSFDNQREAFVRTLCESLSVPLYVEHNELSAEIKRLGASRKPCYICSRSRRLSLFKVAEQHGATIIALGHHRDDFVETLLMNIFYSSQIGTMKPNNPFFGGAFHIIRPMLYIHEYMIRQEAREAGIPEFETGCGFEHSGERAHVKKIISEMLQHYPKARISMFRALFSVEDDYLLKPPSHDSVIK